MEFVGMRPLRAGSFLTEVTLTDGRLLDLYNTADLAELSVRPMSREISLTFRLLDDGTMVRWTFSGVGGCRFEAEGYEFGSIENQELVGFDVLEDATGSTLMRWRFAFTDLEVTFAARATEVRLVDPEPSPASASGDLSADVFLAAAELSRACDMGPLPIAPAATGRPYTTPFDAWRRAVRARDPRLRLDVRGGDLVLAAAAGRPRIRVEGGGGDAWLDASGDEIVLRVPTSAAPDLAAAAVAGVLAGAARRSR